MPEPERLRPGPRAAQDRPLTVPCGATYSLSTVGREAREARAAVLLRIGQECPAHSQSELTWASKPDCGIATMQKALRHYQARAQNKGLNRTSQLQTIPLQ